MDPLPNIPSPPALVWREIRHRYFPPLVFMVGLVAAVFLWRDHAAAPRLIGAVESVVSVVTSGEDGLVLEMGVDRYETVARGDVIAEIRTADPETIRVSLATIATELQVLQTRLAQDQQRILQDYEQLRLNWLRERVALATSRVDLQFAESELIRITKLFADKLVSDDQFDFANSAAEARRAEVGERSRLVTEIEAGLKKLSPDDAGKFDAGVSRSINEAIAAQEAKIQLSKKPVTLLAPINGVVSIVHRRAGERIQRGDPVVTLTATTPERIVGYLRQPFRGTPKTGDVVEVRSRADRRQVGLGKILRIGGALEPVVATDGSGIFGGASAGLPVLISLPENMALLPGESVELALRHD